jgi:hypothetical protein
VKGLQEGKGKEEDVVVEEEEGMKGRQEGFCTKKKRKASKRQIRYFGRKRGVIWVSS